MDKMCGVLENCKLLAEEFKRQSRLQTWTELTGAGEGESVDARCSRGAGEAALTHAAVLLLRH